MALAVTALTGCSSKPSSTATSTAAKRCQVTAAGGDIPASARKGFNYGNRKLAVALWPGGELVAGRLPDGSSWARILPGGSIDAKLGWWRAVAGRLRIAGERLDAPAPALRADVPAGYGRTGFQATGLSFPTEGCWKVTGSVGRAELSFVVLVRKRGDQA